MGRCCFTCSVRCGSRVQWVALQLKVEKQQVMCKSFAQDAVKLLPVVADSAIPQWFACMQGSFICLYTENKNVIALSTRHKISLSHFAHGNSCYK